MGVINKRIASRDRTCGCIDSDGRCIGGCQSPHATARPHNQDATDDGYGLGHVDAIHHRRVGLAHRLHGACPSPGQLLCSWSASIGVGVAHGEGVCDPGVIRQCLLDRFILAIARVGCHASARCVHTWQSAHQPLSSEYHGGSSEPFVPRIGCFVEEVRHQR